MRKVAIVGAGVVGCLTAYELAKAGCEVTLLDRGRLGEGCSKANCGYVSPSHVLPLAAPGAIWSTMKTLFARNSPLQVRPGFALANLGWFLRFARNCNRAKMLESAVGIAALLKSSRVLYDQLLDREQLAMTWDALGLLFVFNSPSAFEHYAEVDHLLTETYATTAERLDQQSLCQLEPSLKPDRVSGAYLYDCDAQLRPDVLMAELRKLLLKLGVTLIENSTLQGLIPQGASARAAGVRTTTGEYLADDIVLSLGAWTPLLNAELGCKVPIIPGKGYSLTMPRPALCPKHPMIFEEHRVAISPFANGFRIGSTMEFAGFDDTMNRDRLKLLCDGAEFYLKDIGEARQEPEAWWGWRPMIHDGKPVIDRSPKYTNVLISAGHGMLGVSMATGTGRLVRELLCGEIPHIDPAHYSLGRF